MIQSGNIVIADDFAFFTDIDHVKWMNPVPVVNVHAVVDVAEDKSHTLEIVPLREYNKNRKLVLVQTEEFYGPTYYHSDG